MIYFDINSCFSIWLVSMMLIFRICWNDNKIVYFYMYIVHKVFTGKCNQTVISMTNQPSSNMTQSIITSNVTNLSNLTTMTNIHVQITISSPSYLLLPPILGIYPFRPQKFSPVGTLLIQKEIFQIHWQEFAWDIQNALALCKDHAHSCNMMRCHQWCFNDAALWPSLYGKTWQQWMKLIRKRATLLCPLPFLVNPKITGD